MKNFILKLIVVIAFFAAAYNVCKYAPYYVEKVHYDKNEIRFVIDDEEKTKSLPDPIEIYNDKVMLSVNTIKKFFDKYAYYNEEYRMVIVAYGLDIVKMPLDSKTITVNNVEKHIDIPVKAYYPTIRDSLKNLKMYKNVPIVHKPTIYVPIDELANVYDIDIVYNNKVIVTTSEAEYYKVVAKNKLNIKSYKMEKCRSMGVSDVGEKIYIFDDFENKSDKDYIWVRSEKGILGYVKKSKISVKEVLEKVAKNDESSSGDKKKISLAWEYAANYTPDRSSESKKSGLDILSPTWFYVKNTNGEILDLADTSYLSWAKRVGYKVWPTIKNDNLSISETSELITNVYKRKAFIDNILMLCKKYNLEGINLDFENMYEKDKNEFSAFVRELSITMKQNDIITSVDVNVPDGSSTWSLCYDSKAISDAVDYIIVMTYDQYGQNSKKAGPVASLSWVEGNVIKMTKRDGIDSTKLVIGIPFYSRSWSTDSNGVVKSSTAVYMSKAKELMAKNPNSITWSESEGQNIISYSTKSGNTIIYVEDANSIAKKLELIKTYNLAGCAAWRLGFETDDIWGIIARSL